MGWGQPDAAKSVKTSHTLPAGTAERNTAADRTHADPLSL